MTNKIVIGAIKITRQTALGMAAAASAALAAIGASRAQKSAEVTANGYNILLISIDDLNDWVEPLGGYPGIVTPNLQRLADMGACFMTAMAHVPTCSPSRTAILTGGAANNTGIYSNKQSWRDALLPPNARSIPGQLKTHGYLTKGSGKLFHKFDQDLRTEDWTNGYWMPADYIDSINDHGHFRSKWATAHQENTPDWGPGDNGARADNEVTSWAIDQILNGWLDPANRFMAVGLFRPHLPFVVGQQFFDLYPQPVANPPGYLPGAATYADNTADFDDLPPRGKRIGQMEDGPRLDEFGEHKDYIRAMLASISFADWNVGRILDAYEAASLASNTYIVLFSDHGWQLGEKMKFRKFTLWERALRVPFMIAGPGIAPRAIAEPVSTLDIYPTIMSLLGLPIPGWCDGRDLSATLLTGAPIDNPAAVSIWANRKATNEDAKYYASVRTPDYRLIKYGNQLELYDHRVDPYEFENIAPSAPQELKDSLIAMLPTSYAEAQISKKSRKKRRDGADEIGLD